MTIEQLDALHKARPFRPFRIHLADDSIVSVKHPELMWRTAGGRTIFVNTGGEKVSIIDLLLVTRLTYGNGVSRKAS